MVDQLAHAVDREVRIHHQHVRRAHRDGEQLEILLRVVAEVLEQRRVDGEDADRSDQKRIAVRLRLLERSGADRPIGAGAVVDNDRLADALSELGGDEACRDIGRAAGRERNNHGNGALGIAGRVRLCTKNACHDERQNSERFHISPPAWKCPVFRRKYHAAFERASSPGKTRRPTVRLPGMPLLPLDGAIGQDPADPPGARQRDLRDQAKSDQSPN